MPLFFLLSLLLAFGAQVVLCTNKDFKFSIAQVKQCEPVFLNFTEGKLKPNTSAPTSLKVLPFDATAFKLPVPSVNVTDSGVQVSFLPLQENASFIATLDDDTGENTSQVSDITRVQPGTSSGCLNGSAQTNQKTFTIANQNDTLSQPRQCENFTVNYNVSLTGAPTVRIYSPKSAAYILNQTADDKTGKATYMMTAGRGAQYLLLYDNGNIMETSPLLTVGGDSSSSKDCFDPRSLSANDKSKDSQKDQPSGGLNQKTVIGLAIGGGIVALIACVLVAYLFWERRHRRRVSIRFDPSMMEKRTLDSESRGTVSSPRAPSHTVYSPSNGGFVQNPPYTASQAPTSPGYPNTIQSWGAAPAGYDSRRNTMNQGNTRIPEIKRSSAGSMRSFEDIEGILNSQEQRLREEEPESPMLSPVPSLAAPAVAVRAIPQRGHLRDPSDVPRAPSRTSTLSGNPFSDNNSLIAPFSEGQPSVGTLLQPPSAAALRTQNKSHFSAVTTSSFGGFEQDSRISGVPSDVRDSQDIDEVPQRRPLPSASGLGRGNGEPR